MTGKQLPRLGITGDGRVPHIDDGILDMGVPQPVLYKGDIRASIQEMYRDRVAPPAAGRVPETCG